MPLQPQQLAILRLRSQCHRSVPRLLGAGLAGLAPDLLTRVADPLALVRLRGAHRANLRRDLSDLLLVDPLDDDRGRARRRQRDTLQDRKSTRLNSSHVKISYAVFCLKKK